MAHRNPARPPIAELTPEENHAGSGDILPLVAYAAAVGAGAAIGFSICAVQGMREARA